MNWVCYLLRCADDTFYCGITNDMEKRLAAHTAGEGAKYTRGRIPVSVVYRESCADKSAALKREIQVKRLSRSAKQALLQGGFVES
jgi:putative endonuclease